MLRINRKVCFRAMLFCMTPKLLHNIVMERDDALETIKQRDKEINALKHMLDRKDDEK